MGCLLSGAALDLCVKFVVTQPTLKEQVLGKSQISLTLFTMFYPNLWIEFHFVHILNSIFHTVFNIDFIQLTLWNFSFTKALLTLSCALATPLNPT